MNHRVAKLAAAILGPATVLAAVLAGAGTASASTIGDYRGAGVEITPTRVEIHLNAMGTATQTFEVENPAPKATIITIGAAAFHQKDTGQLALDVPEPARVCDRPVLGEVLGLSVQAAAGPGAQGHCPHRQASVRLPRAAVRRDPVHGQPASRGQGPGR